MDTPRSGDDVDVAELLEVYVDVVELLEVCVDETVVGAADDAVW
jgi:hypothetical protein